MTGKSGSKMQTVAEKIKKVIGSKYLFWCIIILFILQAAWIAFSYRYPMLYDEAFHVNAIKLFSQQISPIITNQPTFYDMYGSLAHGGATLFHYFLSFPYKVTSMITENFSFQIIILRLINILLVAIGLHLFNKLFKRIGISHIYINIGMLLFTLLPIVPFVSATINYDNLLFALTALFFVITAGILIEKKLNWQQLSLFIIVGCAASLVKYTFLPVFALSVVYLIVVFLSHRKKQMFSELFSSVKTTGKLKTSLILIALVLSLGMFSSIYLYNIIAFKAIQPDCEQILGMERCKNYAMVARNDSAEDTKNTRPIEQLPGYIADWTAQMANWTNMTGARPTDGGVVVAQPLTIVYTTVFIGGFMGLGVIIYSWRSMKKNPAWYFLVFISCGLTFVVFIQNYLTYVQLHMPYAIQPRYLLTIVPIAIVMSVAAAGHILKGKRILKCAILVITLILFSQGGGVITHIVRSDNTWYWENSTIYSANDIVRNILKPLVIEK